MADDGISLTSTTHPTPPWWKRVLMWWCWPRLHRSSLETVEIELKPSQSPLWRPRPLYAANCVKCNTSFMYEVVDDLPRTCVHGGACELGFPQRFGVAS